MKLERRAELAKVSMLEALARSQHAVVRLMEQAAETAAESRLPAALLGEQLRILAHYQSSLISQLTGIRLRQPRKGEPQRPWLSAAITLTSGAKDRHGSSRRRNRIEAADPRA